MKIFEIESQLPPREGSLENLSVIIPFNGNISFVTSCLRAFAKVSPAPQEIIVVADGEFEGEPDEITCTGAKLIQLPYLSSRGPAVARNIGARAARGDILLFVDSDIVVPPTIVGDISRIMSENPGVSGLIGSYDDAPGAVDSISQFRNLLHHYVHQHGCENAVTFWGACGAIRRKAFFEAGGFNELYCRPSIEDIELGYRLHASGQKLLLCKKIQVKHLKRWKFGCMLRTDLFDRAVPWTRLLLKYRHFGHELNLGHCHRASVIFSFMIPISLLMMWLELPFLFLGLVGLVGLMAANLGFLHFLAARHGRMLALKSFGLLWTHYGVAGLGFILGLVLGKFPPDHVSTHPVPVLTRGESEEEVPEAALVS